MELMEGEGRCVVSLFYTPERGGSIVWDKVAIAHLPDNPTSINVLEEFYGATLKFMENCGYEG